MKHGTIVGFLSAGAIAAACTTTERQHRRLRRHRERVHQHQRRHVDLDQRRIRRVEHDAQRHDEAERQLQRSGRLRDHLQRRGRRDGLLRRPALRRGLRHLPQHGDLPDLLLHGRTERPERAQRLPLHRLRVRRRLAPCEAACNDPGDVCPGLQNNASQADTCIDNLPSRPACLATFDSDSPLTRTAPCSARAGGGCPAARRRAGPGRRGDPPTSNHDVLEATMKIIDDVFHREHHPSGEPRARAPARRDVPPACAPPRAAGGTARAGGSARAGRAATSEEAALQEPAKRGPLPSSPVVFSKKLGGASNSELSVLPKQVAAYLAAVQRA